MEINFYKITPIIFSTLAIIISIVTIFFTRQNLKKQLRLAKLEEILEILHFLGAYYRGLYMLFKDTEEKVQLSKHGQAIPEYLQDLSIHKENFVESFDSKTLINKASRLNVLSKAYLPNTRNLKSKTLTIGDIFYAMYTYVKNEGYLRGKGEYSIIPKPVEMKILIEELEEQIIFEMNLGYKNLGGNEHYNYYKNQFEKDLSKIVSLERKKIKQKNSTTTNKG